MEPFVQWENEIRQRYKEQEIDISDCYLMISCAEHILQVNL